MEMEKDQKLEKGQKQTMLFAQLIDLLTQNAVMMLGGVADRQGRQRPPDLNSAELMIDMLSVLLARTKGNLKPEEEKMLSSTLYQLQTAFAEVASKSGDFGKARKATEAAEAVEMEEGEARSSPPPSGAAPTAAHQPAPARSTGIQSSSAQSAETKVKFTKKYA